MFFYLLFYFFNSFSREVELKEFIIPGHDPFCLIRNSLTDSQLHFANEQGSYSKEQWSHGLELSSPVWGLYKSELDARKREIAGYQLFDQLIKKGVAKIDTLSAISYGGEVTTAFLEKNKAEGSPIKINKIVFFASPITHSMVNRIKKNNLFADVQERVFCFYSNRDFTQTLDVTQSFNFENNYRLFYAIRHTMPIELSEKVANINLDEMVKEFTTFQVHTLLVSAFINSPREFKNMMGSVREYKSQYYAVNKNNFIFSFDHEDKKFFRWYHFGKIEKILALLSLSGLTYYAWKKKIPAKIEKKIVMVKDYIKEKINIFFS
jgi:hypothetical protein